MLDPDEQVQTVVRLVFSKFVELGTLNAVLRWLVDHQVQLGVRVRVGDGKGELEWHRPNRMTLQNLLHNPIYAGYYAYGRRQVDPRRQQPGRPATGRVVREAADWLVLLPDQLPAYIPVEQYERNLARLKANQARAGEIGAVRDGTALLAGLVACGRCGRRMTVRYRRLQRPAYVGATEAASYGGRLCQHLAGPCVDRFVTAQVLAVFAPAALELSLAAAAQLERDRAELDRLWRQRLERAGYQAERARRQYQLAEPEHRLVARQLERAWEDTLAAQQQLPQDYRRFTIQQPRVLSADQRAAIRRLAADIPALWDAPTTSDADRKQLIRQVVERVTVTVDGDSERVEVTIAWAGGARTLGELVRPVARLEQLSYWPELAARVRELATAGLPAAVIAQRLNAEATGRPNATSASAPKACKTCSTGSEPTSHSPAPTSRVASASTSGGWSTWPVRLRCRPPRCAPGSTGAGSPPASTPSRPAAGSSGPTRRHSASCASVVGGLRDTTHVAGGSPRNRSQRHAKASKERALCHASTAQATTSTCMWAVCLAHLDLPPLRRQSGQLGRGRGGGVQDRADQPVEGVGRLPTAVCRRPSRVRGARVVVPRFAR